MKLIIKYLKIGGKTMPLQNKYLRYSPEITLEILTLIWNKLLSLEIKGKIYSYYPENNLEAFKKGGYIWIGPDGSYSFGIDNNRGRSTFTETTVQEILGYDPFVKDDFVLQSRWYIQLTEENYSSVVKWHKKIDNAGRSYDIGSFYGVYESGKGDAWANKENAVKYQIITFDQFQKYVLKESIEQPKQPLKQAVHCKTQEEWDFVTEKLGYKWTEGHWNKYGKYTCIEIWDKGYGTSDLAFKNYQILSFQEWCDLNGYKTEKEVKFEVGKWYYFEIYNRDPRRIKCSGIDKEWVNCSSYSVGNGNISVCNNSWKLSSITNSSIKELSIEEIQQYLQHDHPNKITPVIQQTRDMQKANQEFKVGDWVLAVGNISDYKRPTVGKLDKFSTGKSYDSRVSFYGSTRYLSIWSNIIRHATPEEINNHLISIGEIPAGEPLNNGIEPNKDGMFKYKSTLPGTSWSGGTIQNHLDAIIPTTGNSYSKDFSTSIIPVKSISAEVEFNFLPEPK